MTQRFRNSQNPISENINISSILKELGLAIHRKQKSKLLMNQSCTCWNGNRRLQNLCPTCQRWSRLSSIYDDSKNRSLSC